MIIKLTALPTLNHIGSNQNETENHCQFPWTHWWIARENIDATLYRNRALQSDGSSIFTLKYPKHMIVIWSHREHQPQRNVDRSVEGRSDRRKKLTLWWFNWREMITISMSAPTEETSKIVEKEIELSIQVATPPPWESEDLSKQSKRNYLWKLRQSHPYREAISPRTSNYRL